MNSEIKTTIKEISRFDKTIIVEVTWKDKQTNNDLTSQTVFTTEKHLATNESRGEVVEFAKMLLLPIEQFIINAFAKGDPDDVKEWRTALF